MFSIDLYCYDTTKDKDEFYKKYCLHIESGTGEKRFDSYVEYEKRKLTQLQTLKKIPREIHECYLILKNQPDYTYIHPQPIIDFYHYEHDPKYQTNYIEKDDSLTIEVLEDDKIIKTITLNSGQFVKNFYSSDNATLLLILKYKQDTYIEIHDLLRDNEQEILFPKSNFKAFWKKNDAIYILIHSEGKNVLQLYGYSSNQISQFERNFEGVNRIEEIASQANEICFYTFESNISRICSKQSLKTITQWKFNDKISAIKMWQIGIFIIKVLNQGANDSIINIRQTWSHKLIRQVGSTEHSQHLIYKNIFISKPLMWFQLDWQSILFYDLVEGDHFLEINYGDNQISLQLIENIIQHWITEFNNSDWCPVKV